MYAFSMTAYTNDKATERELTNFSIQNEVSFSQIDSLIDKTIVFFHNEQYDKALEICDHIITTFPENPMGYFGSAVIYYGIMRNYWTWQFDKEFMSSITTAIEKSEAAIEKNDECAENYFVYGASLGFRGLYQMKKKEWFTAFFDGINGYRLLKKAYKMNSKFYDAYYGLGTFYYFKSKKAHMLTFLKLMKDEREKGIDFIRVAVENGRFAQFEGHFTLIKIYYDEGQYDVALTECRKIEKYFANNTGYLFLMAKVLEKNNRRQEAAIFFNKLLTILDNTHYQVNAALLAECHFGIAINAYHEEKFNKSLHECNMALKYSQDTEKNLGVMCSVCDFDATLKELNKLFIKLNYYR